MINEPKTGVEGLTLTPVKESILSDLKEGILTGNEIAAKHNVSPSYISKLKPKEKKVKPQQSKTVTHKKLSPMKSTDLIVGISINLSPNFFFHHLLILIKHKSSNFLRTE